MTKLTGGCLCGDISYEIEGEIAMTINCHCTNCQKNTGSVFGTNLFVQEDNITIKGTLKEFKHKSDRDTDMTKFFCPNCGTQICGTNSGRPGMMTVRAGTLNQKDQINPTANIFCDSALSSTTMSDDLKKFDRMPG